MPTRPQLPRERQGEREGQEMSVFLAVLVSAGEEGNTKTVNVFPPSIPPRAFLGKIN